MPTEEKLCKALVLRSQLRSTKMSKTKKDIFPLFSYYVARLLAISANTNILSKDPIATRFSESESRIAAIKRALEEGLRRKTLRRYEAQKHMRRRGTSCQPVMKTSKEETTANC